ncbi:MBL fold metallo-hydrolase [bacterium]|nr:MBL fold metallo-hydrolase [bacterium]
MTTLRNFYPYKIIPIPVCFSKGVSKGLCTYLMDYEKTIVSYSGSFYVSGVEGHHILVDSGPTVEDFKLKGIPCESITPMPEALKKATGLEPQDIDILILTHLHHDHCVLTKMYKSAKVIVQKHEEDSCYNPPACYKALYNSEYIEGANLSFVNGDVINLFPGIHLLYTPGHTVGGQSVAIDTEGGRVVICGLCCWDLNFNPPEELRSLWPEVLVPGIHIDSQEAYESLLRIKKEADIIITTHDEKSYKRGICPSSKWPRVE